MFLEWLFLGTCTPAVAAALAPTVRPDVEFVPYPESVGIRGGFPATSCVMPLDEPSLVPFWFGAEPYVADEADAVFALWLILVAKFLSNASNSRFLSLFRPWTRRSNNRSCACVLLGDGLGRDRELFRRSFSLLFSTVRSSITPRRSSFSLSALCSAPKRSSSLPDETKLLGKYWFPMKKGGSAKE